MAFEHAGDEEELDWAPATGSQTYTDTPRFEQEQRSPHVLLNSVGPSFDPMVIGLGRTEDTKDYVSGFKLIVGYGT